jgi:hypothetical protein
LYNWLLFKNSSLPEIYKYTCHYKEYNYRFIYRDVPRLEHIPIDSPHLVVSNQIWMTTIYIILSTIGYENSISMFVIEKSIPTCTFTCVPTFKCALFDRSHLVLWNDVWLSDICVNFWPVTSQDSTRMLFYDEFYR